MFHVKQKPEAALTTSGNKSLAVLRHNGSREKSILVYLFEIIYITMFPASHHGIHNIASQQMDILL